MTVEQARKQAENILMTLPTSDSGNYYHDELVSAITHALRTASREALLEADGGAIFIMEGIMRKIVEEVLRRQL